MNRYSDLLNKKESVIKQGKMVGHEETEKKERQPYLLLLGPNIQSDYQLVDNNIQKFQFG